MLFAVSLRPASLDRVGLTPALQQYLDSFSRRARPPGRVHHIRYRR